MDNHFFSKQAYKKYLDYLEATNRINQLQLEKEYEGVYFWLEDHLKNDLPRNKDAEILVIGCGAGHEVYSLNRLGYSNVLGIDISEDLVKLAKNKGLNCIIIDAFSFLANCDKKLDVILAFGLIEHFSKKEVNRFLKLCYNSLKDGGMLILKTPNANNPFSLKWIYGDITHQIAFNDTSLTQILLLVGFNTIYYKNVKTFGKNDKKLFKKFLKVFMSIITNLTFQLTKLLYLLNGIQPPKIVSPDLLAVAYKK